MNYKTAYIFLNQNYKFVLFIRATFHVYTTNQFASVKQCVTPHFVDQGSWMIACYSMLP